MCPNTCAHSLTQTHRGREGEVKRYFCLREKQRDREKHLISIMLIAFSKTWTEKSMPTFSTRYSTQLCLIAHSCRHYTTWLPNMTGGVKGWLLEDSCANPSTHVRPLTTAASGDPILSPGPCWHQLHRHTHTHKAEQYKQKEQNEPMPFQPTDFQRRC